MAVQSAELGLLDRPDGSASYSFNGFAVLAAVNGPVEVQRRDEIPDEAAIDVVVRPASGVGTIRERYLESMVHDVLHMAVHTRAHPRTLIQVTLQITSAPPASAAGPESSSSTGKASQASLNLMVLPCLLNAALLALLTTSVPLQMTFAATGVVVERGGEMLQLEPSAKQINAAESVHVFCFGADGTLMLYLAEGPVGPQHLPTIERTAREACIGSGEKGNSGEKMEVEESGSGVEGGGHLGFLKQTILERLTKQDSWRQRGQEARQQ